MSATSGPAKTHPQTDAIALALNRMADVAEKFYAKMYPEHVPQSAVIHRQGDEKRKYLDDKMPEGWEDEQPVEAEPGRFEQEFLARPKAKRK